MSTPRDTPEPSETYGIKTLAIDVGGNAAHIKGLGRKPDGD